MLIVHDYKYLYSTPHVSLISYVLSWQLYVVIYGARYQCQTTERLVSAA